MKLEIRNAKQVAETLGISVKALYQRRRRGSGLPPGFRVGGRLAWTDRDIERWLHLLRRTARI